jgi:hypothetical protein
MSAADTASARSCDGTADHHKPTAGANVGVAAGARSVRLPSRRAVPVLHPYLQSVAHDAVDLKARPGAAATVAAERAAKVVPSDRPPEDFAAGAHPSERGGAEPRSVDVDRSGLLYTDAAHLVCDKKG